MLLGKRCLFRDTVHRNKLCEQNAKLFNIKQVVRILTTVL